jgi:hypothetical protein
LSPPAEGHGEGRKQPSGLSDLWLAARLFLWSLALPILKRLLPLEALVRVAWAAPRTSRRRPELERRVVRLAHAVWARSPAGRSDDNCLERSLAVYRFLSRLNADPELVAGVRKDGSELVGHVWVTVDGKPLGEAAAELGEYAPMIVFGARGRPAWRADAADGRLAPADG